jgi:acyl-coenzyme A synthetase/AMP-(fatty) acid ligase
LLHRIPEWWILIIALIKLGAVYSPAPTMLTTKDITGILPKTISGKIRRNELRERELQRAKGHAKSG